MIKHAGKFWSAVAAIVALAASIFTPLIGNDAKDASAAMDVSRFNPGLIISDSAFYDSSNMSAKQIQNFLEDQVPVCTANPGEPTCLRNYKTNSPAVTGEPGICESMPEYGEVTAAELIYNVAKACGISPKVILVMLQKEQGLVLASRPYYSAENPTRRYTFALGMDCPDTAAGCSKSSAGFFWQLYKGIGQLNRYVTYPNKYPNYQPGTRRIFYHPNDACGRQTVTIQNKATTALYTYTPYVPNAAALNDLAIGTGSGKYGDSCSAYGNRNFWRWYSVWFGDPIAGSSIITSASGATYLLVDNKKVLFDDASTLQAFKPLGPVGKVSQTYLDSFPESGVVSQLIKTSSATAPSYYYVADGKKFTFSNCSLVSVFGMDCTTAVTLNKNQLTFLPTGGNVTEYVPGEDGQSFFIQEGTKRQILDAESLADSRLGVPAVSAVDISAFKKLPWGKPIIRKGVSFINLATKKLAVFDGTTVYDISAATLADIDFTKWFPKSAGSMQGEALQAVASEVKVKSIVNSADGTQYLLTKDGKRKVTDAKLLSKDAPVVSDEFLNLIPTAPTEVESTLFAKSAAVNSAHLVVDGVKRPLLVATDAAKFASAVKSVKTQTLSNSAFAQIPTGSPAIAPGTYVRVGSANYLIDGLHRALVVSDSNQAALLGLGNPRSLTSAQLKGYTKTTKASGIKFVCGENYYIAITGLLYPISTLDASHYPGRGLTLDPMTCAVKAKSKTTLGRFVRSADKTYYLIEGQTKREIKSIAAYDALRAGGPKAVLVGPYFLSKLTTGKPAGSTMDTDAFDAGAPIVPADPAPSTSPSPSASPSVTPAPTSSPKPAASASPSPSPSVSTKPATYKVISGDYWNKIVAKLSVWGVTDATLTAANPKITNKNNLQLGALLVVP